MMKYKVSFARFGRYVSLTATGMMLLLTVGCYSTPADQEALRQSFANFTEGFMQGLLLSLVSNVVIF